MSQARFFVVTGDLRDCSETIIPKGTVVQVSYFDTLSLVVTRYNDSRKQCIRLLREVNHYCTPAASLKWIDADGLEVKRKTSKKFYSTHTPLIPAVT